MTRRYPAYRASGVEWLGEVPEGWKVDRLKASVAESKNGVWGADPDEDPENAIPCIRVADFDRTALRVDISDLTMRSIGITERHERLLVAGDLLLEKSGGGENQLVGAVVLFEGPEPAVCSNFVAKVSLRHGMFPSFWCYVHSAIYELRLNFKSIKQTSGIQNLDASAYFDEPAAFPPLPEQRAIAGFLDRETAKIDALVAEQRRLIDLLREKRQAVISQAVTRGLNPKAPLKPSGTDWLGDVPEGWEVCEARRFVSILSGFAFPSTSFSVDDNDTPLLRGANVGVGELKWEETVYWKRAPDDGLGMFEVQAGDLVIGMDRPWISAGVRVAIVEEHDVPCLLLQRVASLRTDEGLNKEYLRLQLAGEAFIHHFLPDMTGVSVPQISPGQIGGFVIVAPPRDEQDRIVTFLTNATAKFDTLTATAQSAITLLQERRAALISAAVTGKIDVRGLVPELAGAA